MMEGVPAIRHDLAERAVSLVVRWPKVVTRLAQMLARVCRRWPEPRPIRTAAYYTGEALARQGGRLVGTLESGSEIVLDPRDHGHREIYFTGLYEGPTTALFHKVATKGWTVLDVGANAGYFSLLAWDLGGPDSSIHAFEPHPELADLLEAS